MSMLLFLHIASNEVLCMVMPIWFYAKLLKSDSTTASSLVKDAENILGKTPQKLVRSISKAVGKKLLLHNVANILKEEEKNPYSPSVSDAVFKVGPKFEMIATVTLRLDECSKGTYIFN